MAGGQDGYQAEGLSRSHRRASGSHQGGRPLKPNGTDGPIGPAIRWHRATGMKEPLGSNQSGAGTRGFRVLVPVPGGVPGGTGVVSAHLFTMILDALPDEWDSPPAA